MKCKNYIYMQYLASGGSKFMILHKASFSLQQRNKFTFTQMCIKVATLMLSKINNSQNSHVNRDPIPVYEHG